MKIERVLMPTDFSTCADVALDHGLFVARRYDATLHLLHAIVLHEEDLGPVSDGFPSMETLYQRIEIGARTEMGQLLVRRADECVRVEEVVRRGVAAAPTIAAYVEEAGIDLVVIGTHGRRGIRRFLLGSVAEEVVRTVPCPVLTIRDQAGKQGLQRPESLLVPFDFSPASEAALGAALELAKEYGARIDLLHAISPPIDASGYGLAMGSHMEVTAAVTKALDEHAAGLPTAVEVRTHVLHGAPGLVVVRFAEKSGSDLIVVGTHGLEGMSRWLLGSVADKVVRGASCPVLVWRQPLEEEPTASDDRAEADA